MDLDDATLTERRKLIIQDNRFLRAIYQEWYEELLRYVPCETGKILELGSGAGFLEEFAPTVIKSEVFWTKNVHAILSGCNLPFQNGALKAIIMTDVLHHIPQPREFFTEACRCLKPGGVIGMVEPWCTGWSRWVYQNLHYEPFNPDVTSWEFPSTGPLSGANGALPWILFERDLGVFQSEFPDLQIDHIQIIMPFIYLLSGGVSMRNLAPYWSYGFCRMIEKRLNSWMGKIGMFAQIIIRRSA